MVTRSAGEQLEQRAPVLLVAALWLDVALVCCGVRAALLYLAPRWVRAPDLPSIRQLFLSRTAGACNPEPLEQLRYVLAICLAPVLFALLHALTIRAFAHARAPALLRATGSALLFGAYAVQLCVVGFFAAQWLAQADSGIAYVETSELLTALGGSILVLAIVVAIVVLRAPLAERVVAWSRGPGRALPVLAAISFTVCELSSAVYTEGTFTLAPATMRYHLPFSLGEFAAVLNGRTPLVDSFPQYQNLLALLLAPFFKVFGLSITSFSLGMALLSMLTFMSAFWVFQSFAGSAWAALVVYVPFVWMALFPVGLQHEHTFTYYAVGPLRYVAPFVVAAVSCWVVRKPTFARALLLALLAGASVLNNLDFGLPACVAACAVLVLANPSPRWLHPRPVLGYLLLFAASCALMRGGYALFAFATTGQWPQWSKLLSFQRIFALSGFMMQAMPAAGLHLALFATFMAAIFRGYALRASATTADATAATARMRAALLVYAGVFGSGAAMYYVGRSLPNVLCSMFAAWALALFLLVLDQASVWLGWSRALRATDADSASLRSATRAHMGLLVLPTLLLACGAASCLALAQTSVSPIAELRRLRTDLPQLHHFEQTLVQLVRAHSVPDERVFIIYPLGQLVANQAHVQSLFPFVSGESLIVKSQVDNALEQLQRYRITKVFGSMPIELEQALRARGFTRQDAAVLDAPGMAIAHSINLLDDVSFAFWVQR